MTETVDLRTGQTRIQLNDDEIFCRFFKSKTYAEFRTHGSIMSMLGDPAIVQEFLNE